MITRNKKDRKKFTGIWFFGLAGAGKTFATKVCFKLTDKAFIIDGDEVRKLISDDLGYSSSDRDIQIKRVLGLAEIAVSNCQIPVVSTVTMSNEVYQRCEHLGIKIAQIVRPLNQLKQVRDIYATEENVVGIDIPQKDFGEIKLYNNGDESFIGAIKAFVG